MAGQVLLQAVRLQTSAWSKRSFRRCSIVGQQMKFRGRLQTCLQECTTAQKLHLPREPATHGLPTKWTFLSLQQAILPQRRTRFDCKSSSAASNLIFGSWRWQLSYGEAWLTTLFCELVIRCWQLVYTVCACLESWNGLTQVIRRHFTSYGYCSLKVILNTKS